MKKKKSLLVSILLCPTQIIYGMENKAPEYVVQGEEIDNNGQLDDLSYIKTCIGLAHQLEELRECNKLMEKEVEAMEKGLAEIKNHRADLQNIQTEYKNTLDQIEKVVATQQEFINSEIEEILNSLIDTASQ